MLHAHGYFLRVTPDTPGACLSVSVVIVKTDIAAFPHRPQGRRLQYIANEATYGFAFAATRRFVWPTTWAFVRELERFGLPLAPPSELHG